jgi:hypothetical protein
MKAPVYKIILFLFVITIFSAVAKSKNNDGIKPAACRPADGSKDGLNDDISDYGRGFHIVFNTTLY